MACRSLRSIHSRRPSAAWLAGPCSATEVSTTKSWRRAPSWASATAGGTIQRDQLAARLGGALKLPAPEADARIEDLIAAGLAQQGQSRGEVTVTGAGRDLHARIRGFVTDLTQRLWGDLPERDLATTGRTLTTILERANAAFPELLQSRVL